MVKICMATAQLVLWKRTDDEAVSEWKEKEQEQEQKRIHQVMLSMKGGRMVKRTQKVDKASVLNSEFCLIGWTIAMSDNNSNTGGEAAKPKSTRKP